MPNNNHTLLVLLLDASGSMSSLQSAAITGINGFLAQQRDLTNGITGDRRISLDDSLAHATCSVTMIRFSTAQTQYFNTGTGFDANGEPRDYHYNFDIIHNNKNIGDIHDLTTADYPCGGGTPLIDAYCKAIDDTNSAINKMHTDAQPGRVIFLVMTDGEENASKKFKKADLTAKVKTYTDDKNWQFVYLGANQDAIAEAKDQGVSLGNSMTYAPTAGGLTAAFAASSNMVMRKRSASNTNEMRFMNYVSADYATQDSLLGSDMNARHMNTTTSTSAVPGSADFTTTADGPPIAGAYEAVNVAKALASIELENKKRGTPLRGATTHHNVLDEKS